MKLISELNFLNLVVAMAAVAIHKVTSNINERWETVYQFQAEF